MAQNEDGYNLRLKQAILASMGTASGSLMGILFGRDLNNGEFGRGF
jgi:hypothetical protein